MIAMASILICDPLQPNAIEIMGERHEVVNRPGIEREELLEVVARFDAIVVRARTRVDSEVISRGKKLKVIARAGVGTDNIDVDAATQRGVLVVNSPDPSITSVAEHTFGLLLSICRRICTADRGLREGRWLKNELIGKEIEGKTLGIVGLGRIGTKVATMAKAFGLSILATDPYASKSYADRYGAELVPLDELLRRSDFVTLHVPLTESTRHLIGSEEISRMKSGAIIVNTSRSEVVDEDALLEALEEGRISGAALDVFQPKNLPRFARLDNVVLTPHLGASTVEAQSQIAELIAIEVVDALEGRPTKNPVNIPYIDRKAFDRLKPYLRLSERMVAILTPFISSSPALISMSLFGQAAELPNADYLLRTAVVGLLSRFHEVNIVNAMNVAERMGIKTQISKGTGPATYSSSLELVVESESATANVRGALIDTENPRITELLGYQIEFVPEGHIILTQHRDVPGMVGLVGTKLGEAGVNIATMHLSRKAAGQTAMMIIHTDKPVCEEIVRRIREIDGMERVETFNLS